MILSPLAESIRQAFAMHGVLPPALYLDPSVRAKESRRLELLIGIAMLAGEQDEALVLDETMTPERLYDALNEPFGLEAGGILDFEELFRLFQRVQDDMEDEEGAVVVRVHLSRFSGAPAPGVARAVRRVLEETLVLSRRVYARRVRAMEDAVQDGPTADDDALDGSGSGEDGGTLDGSDSEAGEE